MESGPRSDTLAKKNFSTGSSALSNLMNVSEVARRLGVSAATVYGLCDRQELAHVRVANAIRVAPADLAAFVQAAASARTKRRPKKPAAATEPTVAPPEPPRADPDSQPQAQGTSSHASDRAANRGTDGDAL